MDNDIKHLFDMKLGKHTLKKYCSIFKNNVFDKWSYFFVLFVILLIIFIHVRFWFNYFIIYMLSFYNKIMVLEFSVTHISLISLNICSYLMCACLDCSIFASIFFCFKYACNNIATIEIATKANPFVAIQ